MLDFLRKGDVLMVTRIDRLARSIGDLQDIVRAIKAKGASLKATEQPIDTGTAAGKCFLDMLGVFAEFETNLRRDRQLEDIAKAKAAGVYKGRPASIDAAQVRQMKAQGRGAPLRSPKLSVFTARAFTARLNKRKCGASRRLIGRGEGCRRPPSLGPIGGRMERGAPIHLAKRRPVARKKKLKLKSRDPFRPITSLKKLSTPCGFSFVHPDHVLHRMAALALG